MKRLATILVLSLALIAPVATATDPWDVSGDDGSATDNELIPGSVQQHDLQSVGGVADEDWYLLSQKPYSSYEVVVDGVSESVASIPPNSPADPIQLHLVDSFETFQASSIAISAHGSSRALRFRNTTGSEVTNDFIRVAPSVNGCNTACTSTAVYRISMRETTLFAPRFNNSGTQTTVLLLQNTSNNSISYSARFFNASGTLLATISGAISARGGAVINTSATPALVGTSGVISVDHSGGYTALAGKAVALEPATGFSFDTALLLRQ